MGRPPKEKEETPEYTHKVYSLYKEGNEYKIVELNYNPSTKKAAVGSVVYRDTNKNVADRQLMVLSYKNEIGEA